MSDALLAGVAGGSPDVNLFDPDSFVTNSALNGKRGVIVAAEVIRTDYGGKAPQEATVARVTVVSPSLEKPRVNLYSLGAVKPSLSPNGEPALAGPFITGGRLDKNSNGAAFLNGTKAAGFPMGEMGAGGFAALVGADFTWRALEKRVGKDTKVYDIPSEFHGKVDISQLVAALGQAGSIEQAVARPGAAQAVIDADALQQEVGALVLAALGEAEGGQIPRGQLSIKLQPKVAQHPQRVQILSALMKDSTLAAIPGVEYDKKVVKLATQAEQPATEAVA